MSGECPKCSEHFLDCKCKDVAAKNYKLCIARLAYRDIMDIMMKWEDNNNYHIAFHWDECISVDDELFHGWELKGNFKY